VAFAISATRRAPRSTTNINARAEVMVADLRCLGNRCDLRAVSRPGHINDGVEFETPPGATLRSAYSRHVNACYVVLSNVMHLRQRILRTRIPSIANRIPSGEMTALRMPLGNARICVGCRRRAARWRAALFSQPAGHRTARYHPSRIQQARNFQEGPAYGCFPQLPRSSATHPSRTFITACETTNRMVLPLGETETARA